MLVSIDFITKKTTVAVLITIEQNTSNLKIFTFFLVRFEAAIRPKTPVIIKLTE